MARATPASRTWERHGRLRSTLTIQREETVHDLTAYAGALASGYCLCCGRSWLVDSQSGLGSPFGSMFGGLGL